MTEQEADAALEDIRRIVGVGGPRALAKVLPEAVAQATKERGPALSMALEPVLSQGIRDVATRDSEWLGETLAPTIGAAVRKAVSTAFAALMQRFNEALESSLSVRSLRWRLEARRTGTPFAEVVLLHTLVYRVEQVFLIHSETGLVLQHVVAGGTDSADPDQVASTLSAIDTFGRQALDADAPATLTQEFAVGDLRIWIDRGPAIAIAVVIRGIAPRSLLDLVTETRERILLQYVAELAKFSGDVTPFSATRPLLEQCLREQRTQAAKRGKVVLAVIGAVVVALLIAFPGRAYFRNKAEEAELASLQQSVDAEPGIVVTAAERLDGRYRLRGFRDPMARSPTELLAGLGNPPAELAFEPFLSLEPEIVEERFRRLTGAPPGAVVEFSGGTLKLSGEAPRGWLERAVSAASTLPGVGRVDTSEIDARTREMARVTGELESLTVPFAKGSSRLTEESAPRIEQAAALIERLGVLSKELGRGTCVTVLGDSAFPDGRQVNARLAALRAFTVVAALREANPRIDEGMVRAWARNVSDSWRPHQRTARFDVRSATSPQRPCAEGGAG